MKMAEKIAPHENAEKFAIRMLDVDRRSISEEAQLVDVTRRGEAWVASFKKGRGPARDLVSAQSLPDAIAAASARLDAGDAGGGPRTGGSPKRRNPRRWRARRKGANGQPAKPAGARAAASHHEPASSSV
jgi:hypothetical protein